MIPRMFCRHGTNTPSSVPSFAAGGGVFFDPGVGLASPSARSESTPCFAVSRTHCVFVVIRCSPVFWKTSCMLTFEPRRPVSRGFGVDSEAGSPSGAAPPTPAPASGSSTSGMARGCANLGGVVVDEPAKRNLAAGKLARTATAPVGQLDSMRT